jgi:NADPH-dependent 2,4-dienoyl-CoA reductase/sulfur reductase-like enzyme/rhodanese-related sulfurtransferase
MTTLKNDFPKKLLIVGGVAGGATAAARMRRLDESADITILEKGPYVSFANCGLPYFISKDIPRRSSLLLQTPEGFLSRYRVNVRTRTEAVEIRRKEKKVIAKTQNGMEEFSYDKLILAQGGAPIVPALPGADGSHVFTLWTIPDVDRMHKYIEEKKPTRAVIVGGGFIGLEMAEALRSRGLSVTVVDIAPQVMTGMDPEFGAMIKAGLEAHEVVVRLESGVSEIRADGVVLDDGSVLAADLVLLSIGVRPELALAKVAGLELGPGGGVVVDESLRSSDGDIFAVGDMIEVTHKIHGRKVRVPLAGPANRQGRIAGTNALGGAVKYRGALGTSVVKLFEMTAASTGLSERAAWAAGFDVGVSYVFKDHHASYYPGAKPIALKLVYDRKTTRVLGGQAYGQADVEKRIDVLATALHGKMTLEDLSELDLAYAPPYNSANDPLNIAGFVGLNHCSGYSPLKTPLAALEELQAGKGILLDVRTTGERAKAPIASGTHIPADELRDRMEEIPARVPVYIMSKDGFLGHTSLQILKAHGWNEVYNIAGGFSAAKWFQGWNPVNVSTPSK